ncbi:DUF1329 domain-containing protein [Parendozoicomonas sp. Alg238-R29]|uniref:DUF1329 domain-containing protein n=1 Tax=Parendozoicomonas sp. Alg238-R29 TaxID=2993446 RepID=UPI00248E43D1|nr:DUF1329 domain-containing protein [Parendozoicomonas sp. Alg238-R29]
MLFTQLSKRLFISCLLTTSCLLQASENATLGSAESIPAQDEQPLFTITKSNLSEYSALLSEGAKHLLDHSSNYEMVIYPSHQTAVVPEHIAANMRQQNCQLENSGNSISHCLPGSPFRSPATGLEAIWNHLLRYRGDAISGKSHRINVFPNGTHSTYTTDWQTLYIYGQPQEDHESFSNVLLINRSKVIEPVKDAQTLYLTKETINQDQNKPAFWQYFPGPRSVKRMSVLAYDFVVDHSYGLLTQDSLNMFNGSPEKYDWELIGKQIMIVPYNNQKLATLKVDENLLHTESLNPAALRYEQQGVWIVEATLKKNMSHLYSKRRFYLDEDSWQILMADLYDKENNLFRYQEAYTFTATDIPVLVAPIQITYDFTGQGYLIDGLNTDGTYWNFKARLKPMDFTPAALRRSGH